MLRRFLAGVSAIGFAVAGCALVLGIEDKPVRSVEAGATVDAGDRCQHLTPPPEPETDDDRATQKAFVVAAQALELRPDGGDPLGYDLDDTCTCEADAASTCVPPSGATNLCDDPGGIDNGLSKLAIIGSLNSGPAFEHDAIKCGQSTFVLLIQGYNGRANDQEVLVAPIQTVGITEPHDGADTPAPPECGDVGKPTYRPRWDGTDRWDTDTRFFFPRSLDPLVPLKGWVRDWTLVAIADPGKTIVLPIGPLLLETSQATLVAKLEPRAADGTRLPKNKDTVAARLDITDGRVGARVQLASILRTVKDFYFPNFGHLCETGPNAALYKGLKTDLCSQLDIRANPADDRKNMPCDALSAAAFFYGQPAILNDAKDGGAPPPGPCPEPSLTCP